jgi:hypothetical protein
VTCLNRCPMFEALLEKGNVSRKSEAWSYILHKGFVDYSLPTFVKINNKYMKMMY